MIVEKIGWESEGISAAYAHKIRSERIRKIRLGDEVVTLQQKREQSISFSDFAEQKYLPYSASIKKKYSIKREKQLLHAWINLTIGKKSMQEISILDIESIKCRMFDEGKAPRTVEYAIAVIRQIFNVAIRWNVIKGENPANNIKIQKEDNRRIRFLSKKEVFALFDECRKKGEMVYEVVLLSLSTGMRAGEVASLKWQDIDIDNRTISIKDTKNKVNRTAYMTGKVYEMFKKMQGKAPDDYVFTDVTGNCPHNIARTIGFQRIIKRLGFNNGITDRRNKVVFHSLRHTFASWLAMSGVPIYTIKELMGHKTLAMTERYSHLMPDIKREAIKNIDKMMDMPRRSL